MNDDDPKVYQPKLDKNGEPCPEPEPSPMLETASGFKEPSTNCHPKHHQPSAVLIPSSYSRSPSRQHPSVMYNKPDTLRPKRFGASLLNKLLTSASQPVQQALAHLFLLYI